MRLERARHTAKARITRVVGTLPQLLIMLLAAAASLTLPAAVPAQQPAPTGTQARSAAKTLAGEGESIRPFRVNVTQEVLDDLRRRLKATRWPDRETVPDQSQGAQLAALRELVRYWATDYDWRKGEAKLNALPQFMTKVDGVDIHFIHVYRAPETWARRAFRNLIYFHEADRGGHFAAWEYPELFAAELRAAFTSLRPAH
jgi:hypothetical protein